MTVSTKWQRQGLSDRASANKAAQVPTVSDINSWDTSCQHLLFPPRAFPAPLNVVYRSSVTKSFTPTSRGKEEAEVSQQLCLGLCKRGILGM